MGVRAKFQVTSVTNRYYRNASGEVMSGGTELWLTPIYDTSIPEDQRFSETTPSGEMRMMVNNPAAIAYLKPGHSFYVDFTEVPG